MVQNFFIRRGLTFLSFSEKFLEFQNVLLANRFKLLFKKVLGGVSGMKP